MARAQRHISGARRSSLVAMGQHTRMRASSLLGLWHIVEMSEWDEDYCNMEVQAYIRVVEGGTGDFQFGLVTGSLDGNFKRTSEGTLFDFTWEGSDENDPESGDGWLRMKDADTAEGEIRIHKGDKSWFRATRAAPATPKKKALPKRHAR